MNHDQPTRREVLKLGTAAAFASSATLSWAFGQPEYEVVIRNGRVIDPETKLDEIRTIGIYDGAIHAISKSPLKGTKVIDAKGLVVAPGFIDPISHGQDMENDRVQILDGVTTKLQLESGVADQDAWHREQHNNRL